MGNSSDMVRRNDPLSIPHLSDVRRAYMISYEDRQTIWNFA